MFFRNNRKFTIMLAVVMSLMMFFAYADTTMAASYGSSKSKAVKKAKIKTLNVAAEDNGIVVLKWSAPKCKYKVSKYKVYIGTAKSGKFSCVEKVSFTKKTVNKKKFSYKYNSNYPDGTKLYYKVRGYKKVSGKTCYTKYSPVRAVVVKNVTGSDEGDVIDGGQSLYYPDTVSSAENVEYYKTAAVNKINIPIKDKNGNTVMQREVVSSFDREDPIDSENKLHYYNIAQGQTVNMSNPKTVMKLLNTNMTDKDKKDVGSLLYNWADLTDAIIDNEEPYTVISDSKYSRLFTGGNYADLDKALKSSTTGQCGTPGRECGTWSGLCQASSLSSVRKEMTNQVVKVVNSNGLRNKTDLLMGIGNSDGRDNPVLKELMDDTKRNVYYTTVTSAWSAWYTLKHEFSSVSLIFYDFTLKPVADENVDHIGSIDGFDSIEEAKQKGVKDLTYSTDEKRHNFTSRNETLEQVDKSVSYTEGFSESASYSKSNTTSISNQFMVNAGVEFENRFKFPHLRRINPHFDFEYTHQKVYENSQSAEYNYQKSEERSGSVTVSQPPHTYAETYTVTRDTTMTDKFETPMELQYKVAIVAFSGEVRSNDDDAWVRTDGYDHSNFTTFFGVGGDEHASLLNGIDARDSLERRALLYGDSNGNYYDNNNGEVHKFYWMFGVKDDYNKATKTLGINWNQPSGETVMSKPAGKRAIENIVNNVPILGNGTEMTLKSRETDFISKDPEPLYPMDYVCLESRGVQEDIVSKINMNSGEIVNIANYGVKVGGYDNGGKKSRYAPFHGFDQSDGYWIECDKNGNPIFDDKKKSGVIDINEDGTYVTAQKAGTAYMIWAIDDDEDTQEKYSCLEKPNGTSVNAWDKKKGKDDTVINAKNSIVTVNVK